MATNKKVKAPKKKDANTLNVDLEKGKNEARKFAEVILSPTIMNTITTQTFIKPIVGVVDLEEATLVMKEKVEKTNNGDLSDLEATLTVQAVSLNTIYNALAKRSASNMGEYLKAMEIYMRLALKAQAQCTRTIEVLGAIKNPPVVFAKQANIAHGHQRNDRSKQH